MIQKLTFKVINRKFILQIFDLYQSDLHYDIVQNKNEIFWVPINDWRLIAKGLKKIVLSSRKGNDKRKYAA